MNRARDAQRPDQNRIAVIDDDPRPIQSQIEALVYEGHAVEIADNVRDAIELVRRFRPQVVLLDYTLPNATAGEVVASIREADPLVQVVLLNAVSEIPARALRNELGVHGLHPDADGTSRLLVQIESALEHYRLLERSAAHQRRLRQIVNALPEVNGHQPLTELFPVALENARALLGGGDGLIATQNEGLFVMGDAAEAISVHAATGTYAGAHQLTELPGAVRDVVRFGLESEAPAACDGFVVIPMRTRGDDRGCIVVEAMSLPEESVDLCRLYAHHVVQALENAILYERATVDPLTRLYTCGFGYQRLQESVRLASRTASPVSVVMLDLDHFKRLNEAHGRAAGDLVLRHIAQTLRVTCRSTDIVSRHGGEQFIIILPATDARGALVLGQRVIRAVAAASVIYEGAVLRLTASAGVSTSTESGCDADALVHDAEAALDRAKAAGRNHVCSGGTSAQAIEGLRIA